MRMSRTPRSVTMLVAIVGLVALAVFVGWRTVVTSGDPGHYYQYRNSLTLPDYPVVEVLEWVGAIALEGLAAIAFLVLASKTSPALRLLAVMLVYALIFMCMLPFAMHSPPYYGGHLLWLFAAGVWCLVTATAAAIEQWFRGTAG